MDVPNSLIALHVEVPKNEIALFLVVPYHKIAYHFCVPDNLILLTYQPFTQPQITDFDIHLYSTIRSFCALLWHFLCTRLT